MTIRNKRLQTSGRLELSFPNKSEANANWSSRKLFAQALLIVALASLGYCVFILFQFARVQPVAVIYEASSPLSPVQSNAFLEHEEANIGLPVRLKIPAINLDAAIEYVGLTPNGAMGVPSTLVDAAWYNLGPRPGQKGNAVIDGHRSSRSWIPGVFDHLDDLSVGDNLYIEDDQGTIITFVVREIRIYDPEDDASDVFKLSDSIHLNLITCSGDWDTVQKSFNKRLVIFTDVVL